MSYLSMKTRQQYLKELGFYSGKVDGIEGTKTKKSYAAIQNKYFTRSKDKDGVYGTNTDVLLRNAYKCSFLKHFELTEFKCHCEGKYCTGYPFILSTNLLAYLDDMREHFNKPIMITSGLRCGSYNYTIGGTSTSKHISGRAVDIKIKGLTSITSRKKIINHWIDSYDAARYGYCVDYGRTKTHSSKPTSKTMGSATHLDVIY